MQKRISVPLLAAVMSGSLVFAAQAQDEQTRHQDPRITSQTFDERDRRDHQGQQRVSQSGELTRKDLKVAEKAMNASAGSIELARIAEERARNNELRQFSRTVREHHREANQELASLSPDLRAGQARPEQLDRWAIDRLNAIENDREFEQAYAELMVARHRMAIDGLEMLANDERYSRELRDNAQQQLNALRQHLRVAQRLEQDVRQVAGSDWDD
jgi:predicted outer membrane protein